MTFRADVVCLSERQNMITTGTKVIVRSNEDEPLLVGEFVGYADVTGIPMIESEGKVWLVMGVIIPHSDEMFGFLESLTNQRQWEILSQMEKLRPKRQPLTTVDLTNRAKKAIENREDCAYEVAIANGQILDNVAHMQWFVIMVAVWFQTNVKRWANVVIDV